MKINALHAIDFYKTGHIRQYPKDTTEIYSNFTPRHSMDGAKEVVFFGLQFFIKDFLQGYFQEFFKADVVKTLKDYTSRMDDSLGKGVVGVNHLRQLHELGYLPLKIKALPEGSLVPIGVPVLTIVNTHPDFFWLPNYLEGALSCYLWKAITSATKAYEYKKLLTRFAIKTGTPVDFVKYQAHDFSFRGMSSLQDAALSGAAHLTSFHGTDSVLSLDLIEEYYSLEDGIGGSVPATEHSVMCMGGKSGELDTIRRLITEVYPTGPVSIVCDTWDFWNVVTNYLPILKNEIMARDGKVIIRPDSGNPVKIICGDIRAPFSTAESKGLTQCLWETFGGTVNEKGYKVLDGHIGMIYGDSITTVRALDILNRLDYKKFSSGNIVFGVGSFTYQYVTRDTHGFAMKATSAMIDGQRIEIYKDPKTDCGTKKSAKGLLSVEKEDGRYVLYDEQTECQEKSGELKVVFENGELINRTGFTEIRGRINKTIEEKR
ncbi:PncB Nicotinic acid phosphoribosyltransferase [uncultured Caudovirales phage]|uniref:Nicotinamide phosphoribosyltransferase n=1 Tax=uncultured Caudovirales phage TaxID=2100421 RepID=A0A6J5RUC0_9CAUD|nr:PncB Nicotinic acid phosphoribosyltransferase [uncultured Caudovirales phage]